MDEAESDWDILGSDAAASVMSDQNKEEVEKTEAYVTSLLFA